MSSFYFKHDCLYSNFCHTLKICDRVGSGPGSSVLVRVETGWANKVVPKFIQNYDSTLLTEE